MQLKTYVKTSSLVSTVVLAGLFMLQAIMPDVAGHWINAGTELSTTQKVLIGLAAFWSKFWWLASPPLICVIFIFVGAIAILQGAFAMKRLR